MTMIQKILCVDDDANILSAYQRTLRKQFTLETALGGEAGLEMLRDKGPYAVVVSDMSMPGMNGIEFLTQAKEVAPNTVRMMLTGNADLTTVVEALHHGSIFRYLMKPCPPDTLAMSLQSAIDQYQLITAERDLLEKTLQGSIRVLVEILAMVSPDLFGRAQALRGRMRTIAEALGMSQAWKLELAAMLSQIGLVTLPTTVLRRLQTRQPLTDTETQMLSRVPEISHNLIANIPRLEPVAEVIRYSGKRYNGTGVPADAVLGTDIPVGARLLLILTDLAELEANKMSIAGAFAVMQRREGFYDPKILEFAMARLIPGRATSGEPGPHTGGVPIAAASLKLGHMLAADIETSDGTLLISAGHEITETILERIRNFTDLSGIREPVYVVRYAVAPPAKAA